MTKTTPDSSQYAFLIEAMPASRSNRRRVRIRMFRRNELRSQVGNETYDQMYRQIEREAAPKGHFYAMFVSPLFGAIGCVNGDPAQFLS